MRRSSAADCRAFACGLFFIAMTLADVAIGFGLLMFAACCVVVLLWFSDPLVGPDEIDRP